ncbi:MAG: hypothetical protein JSS38_08100 [Nitrospira sp.]|nr:hypothetical protein [Nitrospira sp.]
MSTINGTAGNDTLVGDKFPFHLPPLFNNADTINGFDGNDILRGLSQNDTLNGGNGNDQLFGGSGNDTLRGNNGADFLDGGTGADNMNGGDQNDTYIVDNVGDVTAESFNDALGGVDTVQSSAAFHTIGFGIENLTLTGAGNISGTGNANANIINGNNGNNTLSGLAGNDSLFGDSGNDVLTGGLGKDFLSGGLGNDRFDYNSTSESPTGALNRDVISGFTGNGAFVGDQIDLRDIDANTTFLSIGNQAFSYIGGAAFSNVLGIYTPGQLRYSGGVLQGNTDFDGAAEIEIALVPAPASLYVNSATPLTTDILL